LRKLIYIIAIVILSGLPAGASAKVDSLKTVIETADHDTTKIKALNQLSRRFWYSNPDTSFYYANKALELANNTRFKKGKATALRYIGVIYTNTSDFKSALEYCFKSAALFEEIKDKKGLSGVLNSIGIIYEKQSDYPQALDYYFKAVKIWEELENKQNLAAAYNNIGIIYYNQSAYPQALAYYFKSLKILEEQGNKRGMAQSYSNIGSLYTSIYEQSDSLANGMGGWGSDRSTLLDSALYYQRKALLIEQELSDEWSMSQTLAGIGAVYTQKRSTVMPLKITSKPPSLPTPSEHYNRQAQHIRDWQSAMKNWHCPPLRGVAVGRGVNTTNSLLNTTSNTPP